VSFPFSAVVGHADLRLALLLAAVDPAVGGVLVRGEKGTAKSTTVRALARLLPSPAPFVELPVGATEDRVLGTLDLERAVIHGVRAYHPGMLAAAHRGVLYVDEVNLLPDHVVDVLLDAAATGRVHVERDGLSVARPASFLLVGTMNPEEGELRPQLLDRFGLVVDVRAPRDVGERVEVMRRRLAFEADPAGFGGAWAGADAATAGRIAAARGRVGSVGLPDGELRRIAAVCAGADVAGMRADLVIARAARAHAAWRGVEAVAEEDVRVAARLALPHRAGVHETEPLPTDPPEPPPHHPGGSGADGAPDHHEHPIPGSRPAGDGQARPVPPPSGVFRARLLQVPGVGEGAPGRRSRARIDSGRVIRAAAGTPRRAADVHLPATLAAAAPYQRSRGRVGPRLLLRPADLRRAEREGREGNLVLFAVDASGSMAARARMAAVSGAVLSLLRDAYQRRDKVGLVTFRAAEAEVVVPPTSSVPAAQARLASLRTGGRTPLAGGLLRARRVLAVERLRDPRRRPLLVLLTDGRATVPVRDGGNPVGDACRAAGLLAADGVTTVVVDCESGPVRLGLAARVAAAAGGELVTVADLSAERVAGVVRGVRRA
jgi:magnesium chelatase subunit D